MAKHFQKPAVGRPEPGEKQPYRTKQAGQPKGADKAQKNSAQADGRMLCQLPGLEQFLGRGAYPLRRGENVAAPQTQLGHQLPQGQYHQKRQQVGNCLLHFFSALA